MLPFFQILPNIHFYYSIEKNEGLGTVAQLVVRLSPRHEVMGSNPCRSVKFLAENIPVFSGRLLLLLVISFSLQFYCFRERNPSSHGH